MSRRYVTETWTVDLSDMRADGYDSAYLAELAIHHTRENALTYAMPCHWQAWEKARGVYHVERYRACQPGEEPHTADGRWMLDEDDLDEDDLEDGELWNE